MNKPASPRSKNIFEKLKTGVPVYFDDPDYHKIDETVDRTLKLVAKLNTLGDVNKIREQLGEIIGQDLPNSTTVFAPLYTNFGKHIKLGKGVFINHAVSLVDMGGITIENKVLIGPKANILTENHPVSPQNRRTLITKPVTLRRKTWIGAAATILPGVTVGENSIVAAGAVVTKDVPANVMVAGTPAKVIKEIE